MSLAELTYHGNHPRYRLISFIQVVRNGVPVKARLAQLLTEGTSPNPRWLIKFDGQPFKDEEVYEHTFKEDSSESEKPMSRKPPSRSNSPPPPLMQEAKTSSPSEEDDSTSNPDVSAREQRSRRRQALIDIKPPKKVKRMKETNEPVTKIKLLTGTLYLYRGEHRRAEFVRRI